MAPITSDKTVFCFHSCTFQQRKFPWKYLFSHGAHPQMILVLFDELQLVDILCDVSFGLSCKSGHGNIVISHCTSPCLSLQLAKTFASQHNIFQSISLRSLCKAEGVFPAGWSEPVPADRPRLNSASLCCLPLQWASASECRSCCVQLHSSVVLRV